MASTVRLRRCFVLRRFQRELLDLFSNVQSISWFDWTTTIVMHTLTRRCLQQQSRHLWNRCRTSTLGFQQSGGIGSRFLSSGYEYSPLFQSNIFQHVPEYTKLLDETAVETQIINGQEFLRVTPEAMKVLSEQAFGDIAHLLRPAHLQQLRNILDDPEASDNDHFVAMELLKNANNA